MQCPDCGYMMSAFDKDCARCKTVGKPAGPAAPAAPPLSAPPPQANLSAPPVPTPSPQVPAAPISALPGDALACPVCGNQATQKVSAICEAGTWTTNSRSNTTMVGSDGAGHLMMMGGPTQTSSLSQTGLANRLMPPPRPRSSGFSAGLGMLALVLGLGGLGLIGSGIGNTWDLVEIGLGLCLLGGGVAVVYQENNRATADHQATLALLPSWEQARVVWNRIFYCGRCDHAYDAQTRVYAPAGEMYGLYPPMQVKSAQLAPPDGTGKTLALVGAAIAGVFLLIAWFMGQPQRAGNVAAPEAVAQQDSPPSPATPTPVSTAPAPVSVSTAPPPAIVMRTKAGGGSANQFSASGPNVNLPPVTLSARTGNAP